jgi:hypothetical protein
MKTSWAGHDEGQGMINTTGAVHNEDYAQGQGDRYYKCHRQKLMKTTQAELNVDHRGRT